MEPNTIENPVLKDTSDLEARLLDAAGKADLGEDYSLPSANETEPRATVEPESSETNVSSPDTAFERPRDELGRFTKDKDGNDIPESARENADRGDVAKAEGSKPPESKDESAYAKAAKERERRENLLKNFETEKETFRREAEQERQRIAHERAQLEQSRQQQTQGERPQYSAKEYADFATSCTEKARQLRGRDEYDAADEQIEVAAQAVQLAIEVQGTESTTQYQQAAEYHEKMWLADLNASMQKEPEIASVMQGGAPTPLANEVRNVLSEGAGVLERIPNGGSYAIYIAKLRTDLSQKSDAVSGLEQKIKTLTAERDALRGKTSLSGSSPTSPNGRRSLEDMSIEELETSLKRQAALADAGM